MFNVDLSRLYGNVGVDFLLEIGRRADCIVTNPPFKIADEFILHALDLGVDTGAMFLRTKFLEGATHHRKLHSRFPPARIFQFIERIKFYGGDTPKEDRPGWNTEAFAWFIWRRGYAGSPAVQWVHRDPIDTPFLFDAETAA